MIRCSMRKNFNYPLMAYHNTGVSVVCNHLLNGSVQDYCNTIGNTLELQILRKAMVSYFKAIHPLKCLVATHLMKPLDDALVVLMRALDHASQRVGEPLLELSVGREHMGHKEMHQRPQLHQGVLKGCARQQQAPLTREVQQHLPTLRLEILDVLGLKERMECHQLNAMGYINLLVQDCGVVSHKYSFSSLNLSIAFLFFSKSYLDQELEFTTHDI